MYFFFHENGFGQLDSGCLDFANFSFTLSPHSSLRKRWHMLEEGSFADLAIQAASPSAVLFSAKFVVGADMCHLDV